MNIRFILPFVITLTLCLPMMPAEPTAITKPAEAQPTSSLSEVDKEIVNIALKLFFTDLDSITKAKQGIKKWGIRTSMNEYDQHIYSQDLPMELIIDDHQADIWIAFFPQNDCTKTLLTKLAIPFELQKVYTAIDALQKKVGNTKLTPAPFLQCQTKIPTAEFNRLLAEHAEQLKTQLAQKAAAEKLKEQQKPELPSALSS